MHVLEDIIFVMEAIKVQGTLGTGRSKYRDIAPIAIGHRGAMLFLSSLIPWCPFPL